MALKCNIVSADSIRELATLLQGEKEVYLVYDENVAWVAENLPDPSGAIRERRALGTSEDLKTMETVLALERWLLAAGASRNALLLAVGGGITTDLVGFAAAIYKRGIRYANVPTTLLAQVDAAIGGKTGVNLDGYKNMVGAFRMPEFTFLCAETLRTLPPREFRAGLAEMLKTFLIGDAVAYTQAVKDFTPQLIDHAAAIKAGIVENDPFEQGERAKLNLGHTFAHAIEHQAQQCGGDIRHGEAVAMGIILAARLGENEGITENGLTARLEQDFVRLGLPVNCPYRQEALLKAMALDKKAQTGGKVRFVLPETLGKVVFKEWNPYDLHVDTK